MTDIYDTPWDMAVEFLDEMGHSQHEKALLEHYQIKDQNSTGELFPVLHKDNTEYGIVLETSPDTDPSQFPTGYQTIRVEGELPANYDLESEIDDIEKYKRSS